MARICSKCKHYTTGTDTVCPFCNIEMQFTMLPPQGQPVLPLPVNDLRSLPSRPRRQDRARAELFDLFRFIRNHRLMVGSPFGLILVLGGLFFGWGQQSLEDRFDQIEIGMSELEVRSILSPPVRSRRWRSPSWHNQPTLSTEGYASFVHSEPGGTVHVEFMDGAVTNKTLEPNQTATSIRPSMPQRQTGTD